MSEIGFKAQDALEDALKYAQDLDKTNPNNFKWVLKDTIAKLENVVWHNTKIPAFGNSFGINNLSNLVASNIYPQKGIEYSKLTFEVNPKFNTVIELLQTRKFMKAKRLCVKILDSIDVDVANKQKFKNNFLKFAFEPIKLSVKATAMLNDIKMNWQPINGTGISPSVFLAREPLNTQYGTILKDLSSAVKRAKKYKAVLPAVLIIAGFFLQPQKLMQQFFDKKAFE